MMILALVVLTLVFVNTILIISGSVTFNQKSKYSVETVQAIGLAEAAIDKAVASLNVSGGTYNGESDLDLGGGVVDIQISAKDPQTNIITATSYIPSKQDVKARRTVSIQVSKGTGISFVYGMLVGNGGIAMGNGSRINGSIYSNGNISGGNNQLITGDVYVAGGTQPTSDQQTECVSPNCLDFLFGRNVSGNNQLDVAQSFESPTGGLINKVSLRLKKVGSPPNITIRLLGDSNGKPNKNNVLASGTLSANLVTTEYGFVDVAFTSSPTISPATKYWIMLDTSSNNSNYWSWSQDSTQGYTQGSASWSSDWQTGNPTWTAISGDLGFKTWMGGVATSLSFGNGSNVSGDVHANTISGVTIAKDAYYQLISNSNVLGTSYPNSADPAPIPMPISEANITAWKGQAEQLGVTNGNVTGCPSTMGPGKILGNINISNTCTVTVTTPIWVTGTFTVGNSVILRMDPSMGTTSGAIIVDGVSTFSNGNDLLGTGMAGSYLTLLSTYNSESSGIDAIVTGNSSITGILYAPYGQVTLANNASFKEVVAWKIITGTGTILTYDSGLVSTFFSSGPSGSYTAIKGTYQSK